MANLIIKPTSGGSLILQDEGGDAALTVGTTGSTTLAGTTNNVGTVTGGTISNAVTGVNTKHFGFSAYLSTAKSCSNSTWTEINTVWTEFFDTNSKFGTTTGRFTPLVAGIYHCGYVLRVSVTDDAERTIGSLRLNGTESATTEFARFEARATGTDLGSTVGGSALIVFDADDYISMWAHQASGGTGDVIISETQIWGYYVGTV